MVRYSCLRQPLVVSLLLPLVSTVFSVWSRIVSFKFFNTQIPSVSPDELCAHSLCPLSSSLERTQRSAQLLSLHNRQYRESFMQHLRSSDPIHFSWILHGPATDYLRRTLFGYSLLLCNLVQALESSASGASWSSTMPPSLGRVGSNNNIY